MALNTTPIFVSAPNIQWTLLSASNATAAVNRNGTGVLGTDIMTVFTASVSGSRVESITIQPLGTNVQTSLNFFINSGLNTVSSNNGAFYTTTMPATVINTNTALEKTELQFPNGINLQSGSKILASTNVTVATGFHIVAFGGDY
jgi:hypothetical protein